MTPGRLTPQAQLAQLLDGCAQVDRLIARELDTVRDQDDAETLIAIKDWLRGQRVALFQQLEKVAR